MEICAQEVLLNGPLASEQPPLLAPAAGADNLRMEMSDALHPLDFAVRQAAKAASREADRRALADGTKTPEQIKAQNYWFYGLRPEQIRVDFNSARQLY